MTDPRREMVARIIRGWDKPPTEQRIGPGTQRAITEADAKADAILAALVPEGVEAENQRLKWALALIASPHSSQGGLSTHFWAINCGPCNSRDIAKAALAAPESPTP